MNVLEYLVRFVIGGGVIVLVNVIAKYGSPEIAGMFALAPIITSASFFFMGRMTEPATVRHAVMSSLYSIPLSIVFLFSLYLALGKFSTNKSMLIALCIWFVGALVFSMTVGRK